MERGKSKRLGAKGLDKPPSAPQPGRGRRAARCGQKGKKWEEKRNYKWRGEVERSTPELFFSSFFFPPVAGSFGHSSEIGEWHAPSTHAHIFLPPSSLRKRFEARQSCNQRHTLLCSIRFRSLTPVWLPWGCWLPFVSGGGFVALFIRCFLSAHKLVDPDPLCVEYGLVVG